MITFKIEIKYLLQFFFFLVLKWEGGISSKEPTCQCRRRKRYQFDPWSGRYPGGGHGNPLQYSCLENRMDRRAWHATVLRVSKSRT